MTARRAGGWRAPALAAAGPARPWAQRRSEAP